MIKLVFEGAYKPGYDPKLKLKTFNEYFSKIPNSSSTFVKLINFAGDVSILNVVGVELSENLHDPSTITAENPGQIHIVYSEKEGSKPCTAKKFAEWCKKCFEQVKDLDPETISVVLRQDDKKKTDRFRFYYDDETNSAIIARNVSGAQKIADYIQAHIEDFKKATKSAKKEKLPSKKTPDGEFSIDDIYA